MNVLRDATKHDVDVAKKLKDFSLVNTVNQSYLESEQSDLIKNANASASYQTWRSVKSVDRRIRECAADLKVDMSFPWNAGQVTTFTAWCLRRNLREKSIQNYLSKVNSSTQSNLTSELFSFLGKETP